MTRKTVRSARPSEVLIDELGGDQNLWDLDKHLTGCLTGYQADPKFGTLVYFALEALWGIKREFEMRAKAGKFDLEQLDEVWIIAPTTSVPVPWIWIVALATAWSRYEHDGEPLGEAFGLEGGQGKPPIKNKQAQQLDERAIVHWMRTKLQDARAEDPKARIEDIVQGAAEKFNKSDGTIRRYWQRFAHLGRLRQTE